MGLKRTAAHPWRSGAAFAPFRAAADPLTAVLIRLVNDPQSSRRRAESGWATIRPPMYLSSLSRRLMEPQAVLVHSFNCSATAAINYPSLRDSPNGCQGHPRPCLSPLDRPLVTETDSNDVRTRSTFIQLLA